MRKIVDRALAVQKMREREALPKKRLPMSMARGGDSAAKKSALPPEVREEVERFDTQKQAAFEVVFEPVVEDDETPILPAAIEEPVAVVEESEDEEEGYEQEIEDDSWEEDPDVIEVSNDEPSLLDDEDVQQEPIDFDTISDEMLRELAKEHKIKSWHNKSREKLVAELTEALGE